MHDSLHSQRRRRSRAGQAIAEFAISAIVLLLLLLAILQFAFLYNAQIGVTNSVRDAARYGSSLTANDDGTTVLAANSTESFLTSTLTAHVSPYYSTRLAAGSGVCFEEYSDPNLQSAIRIRVTAIYEHPLVVPLISAIIDGFDGSNDGFFAMTSSIELHVDNPAEPVPNLSTTICRP